MCTTRLPRGRLHWLGRHTCSAPAFTGPKLEATDVNVPAGRHNVLRKVLDAAQPNLRALCPKPMGQQGQACTPEQRV